MATNVNAKAVTLDQFFRKAGTRPGLKHGIEGAPWPTPDEFDRQGWDEFNYEGARQIGVEARCLGVRKYEPWSGPVPWVISLAHFECLCTWGVAQ